MHDGQYETHQDRNESRLFVVAKSYGRYMTVSEPGGPYATVFAKMNIQREERKRKQKLQRDKAVTSNTGEVDTSTFKRTPRDDIPVDQRVVGRDKKLSLLHDVYYL